MVKVIAPLFSKNASGSLMNKITYAFFPFTTTLDKKCGSKGVVTQWHEPGGAPSEKQINIREIFQDIAKKAKTLTEEEKKAWIIEAAKIIKESTCMGGTMLVFWYELYMAMNLFRMIQGLVWRSKPLIYGTPDWAKWFVNYAENRKWENWAVSYSYKYARHILFKMGELY